MSDFLTNLIARTYAVTPAIQPRLPSLFETLLAATDQRSGFSPASPGFPAPEPPAAPDAVSPIEAPSAIAAELPPQPALPPEASSATPPSEAHIPNDGTERRTPFRREPASTPLRAETEFGAPAKHGVSAYEPATRGSFRDRPATDPAGFEETAPRPLRPANRPAPPAFAARPAGLRMAAQESRPTIRVTIGRVEVRAVQSPAPAPKAAKPAQPRLSLDEYLKPRAGGSR